MKRSNYAIISVVAVVILLLIFGSKMFFVLKPGERAVVFKQFSSVGLDKDNILTPGFLAIAPWNKLIRYDVRSRAVTGRYTAEEIYSTKRGEVESAIIETTRSALKTKDIEMKDLLIRSISLPDKIKQAIESKLQQQQEALAYQFRLDREKSEADRLRIQAQGIADYNKIISATLTDRILQQKGIDATLKLANSANSEVVVIGSGDDGMPLILGGN